MEATTESEALFNLQYHWHLYERVDHRNTFDWKEVKVTDLTNMHQLLIRDHTLNPDRSYKVTVIGQVHGRNDGYSEKFLTVNIPPRYGRCSVDKRSGYSYETVFNIMCEGWIDEDLPLSYEFQYQNRYGVVFLLHYGTSPVFSTSLPVGDAEANFTLDFRVKICDTHGTYNITSVDVQVKCES